MKYSRSRLIAFDLMRSEIQSIDEEMDRLHADLEAQSEDKRLENAAVNEQKFLDLVERRQKCAERFLTAHKDADGATQ